MVDLLEMADISHRLNRKMATKHPCCGSFLATTPKTFMTDRFVVNTTASNSLA
jgi:hypothetical protein